jgi:hypothetical protein
MVNIKVGLTVRASVTVSFAEEELMQMCLEQTSVLKTLQALEHAMERIANVEDDESQGSQAYFALNEVQAAIERLQKYAHNRT